MTSTLMAAAPVPATAGPLDPDVPAYLARLGLDAEPPSAAALARLHRAHVERVPYETFWIHLGEGWGIDPAESMHRIARTSRGGYCYQLNGAFARLLGRLGYRVTHHVGGVHDAYGPGERTLTNHVVLIVHDLATEANPGGRWYADTGLGDALYEPLPLRTGEYRQEPMRVALAEVHNGVGDWHLQADPAGSLTGVSFRAVPTGLDTFRARHRYNVTSPESGFARTVTAQRRHSAGSDILRGCVVSRRHGATTSTQVLSRRRDWLEVIRADFGLRVFAPPARLDALWRRVCAAHEAWLTAQAASAETREV